MSEMNIKVEKREATGKNANRQLRASGALPAVVYGDQKDPVPITIDRKKVIELLKKGGGENAVFKLELEGAKASRHAMIRDLQIDPISRRIIHIDFQRINLSEKVKVQVAIHLQGEPDGVKNQGGVLDFITREVEVECLPSDIPQSIDVEVGSLEIGDHIEAKDLSVPAGVELLSEPDQVIVSVSHSRVAAEIEELEAEAEGAAETLIEAQAEEPEVIGKGKEDDEDEDTD